MRNGLVNVLRLRKIDFSARHSIREIQLRDLTIARLSIIFRLFDYSVTNRFCMEHESNIRLLTRHRPTMEIALHLQEATDGGLIGQINN